MTAPLVRWDRIGKWERRGQRWRPASLGWVAITDEGRTEAPLARVEGSAEPSCCVMLELG